MNKRLIDVIFELKSGCFEKEESIQIALNLSPAEFRGILALAQNSVISCKELSKKMGLSYSRVSRVVEKLMKHGYLKEVHIEGDRRILYLKLADKGLKIKKKIRGMMEECEQDIQKKITPEEEKSLVNILSRVTGILK